MKTKPLSILVSVPVLSVVIFAVALLLVLLAGVNSPGDKIGGNWVFALVIAFGLVVLVWVGAAVEFVLSRVRIKSIRIIATISVFIVLPIFLCIGLPILVAVAGNSLFASTPTWKSLPALSSPAMEIVGADHITVYVRTLSGNVVRCFVTQPSSCWESTRQPSTRILVSTANQRQSTNAPAVNPPGQTVSLLGVAYGGGGSIPNEIHYAVLADGSVWYLQKDVSGDALLFAGLLVLPFLALLSIAGMAVIYLGAGVNFLSRRLAGN